MADWQAGDLAFALYPRAVWGKIFTVSSVVCGPVQTGLRFVDHVDSSHPSGAWCASTFRKVTPPAADEFVRETIALENSRPVRVLEENQHG